VRVFFQFEEVFQEGEALGVVGLDFCHEFQDDGEETKVNLGGVSSGISDSLSHALFPIVGVGVLGDNLFPHGWEAGDSVASLAFIACFWDRLPGCVGVALQW
jgi:hypothetical protein